MFTLEKVGKEFSLRLLYDQILLLVDLNHATKCFVAFYTAVSCFFFCYFQVTNSSCTVHADFADEIQQCFDAYTATNEERESFGPGTEPAYVYYYYYYYIHI